MQCVWIINPGESSSDFRRSSDPAEARKFTQIIFVLAVSFGCFIHGTTVSYPSVFMPGLERTNATKNNNNSRNSNSSNGGLFPDTLPFYVYDEDISLMGERRTEKLCEISIVC